MTVLTKKCYNSNAPKFICIILYFISTLANELYGQTVWKNWKDYYSMHLLSRHRNYLISQDVEESGIIEFNEKNIQTYTKPFGEIARSIWNKVEVKKYW